MGDLAPGTVVAGYRIEALIGRGGMGVVYAARQSGLDRMVALKVIAPELLDDPDVRERFLAEARAAASVDHANVIPVYDAGEADDVAYIAMRYVGGEDLRSLVRARGPLEPDAAAEIIAQAGAALDAIHRAGFVHRDVKPANLLVDEEQHVYLTDFGLAKAVLTRAGGTRTGQWVGTLDYVAPEQIRGGRIDARADVYALGGVLHFALTGRVPFEREGDEAKLWAQLSAPPPVPSSLRRGVKRAFDGAVARAMAKDPEERYPSAGDLGRAAVAAVRGRAPGEPERMVARGAAAPGAAPTEPGLAAEASTRTTRPVPVARSTRGPRAWAAVRSTRGSRQRSAGAAPVQPVGRPRRWPFVAAGAVVAAGVVAVVLVAISGDDPASRAATPTPTASPTPTPTPTVTATATPGEVAAAAATIEKIGSRPTGIAFAGGDLWVISPRSPYLTRIDASTDRERSRHPKVGRDSTAIVGDRDTVWVTNGSERLLIAIDADTAKERWRVPVPAGPRRLAVDARGVWVGTSSPDGEPGLVLRYDRETGVQQEQVVVNEGVGAMASSGDALWIVKRDSNALSRLDPGVAQFRDIVSAPGPVRSMSFGAGALWLVLAGEDTIARYAMDGREPVTAAAGSSPTTALVAGNHLFVSSRNDQSVLVFDPVRLRQVQDPIPVGFNPISLAASEDGAVWVTSLGDNTVTRIELR